MKKNNSTRILYVFGFSLVLVLLAGCAREDAGVVLCSNSPDNANCTCPAGLIKASSDYGDFCVNTSCTRRLIEPKFNLNGKCVDSCPDENVVFQSNDYEQDYYICAYIKNISKDKSCNEFPEDDACTCTNALIKVSTAYGYFCANPSCDIRRSDAIRINCTKGCPDGYIMFGANYFSFCFLIKNDSDLSCDKFRWYESCTCPEGQKQSGSQSGIYCVDNSHCNGYILPDNRSNCLDNCPEGYTPLSFTTPPMRPITCLNTKKIDESNIEDYAYYIMAKPFNSSIKDYVERCWAPKSEKSGDKFKISVECSSPSQKCSFYIYPNASIVDIGCSDG